MTTRITVKVQPRAKTTGIDGTFRDGFKLKLAAPPVDGKANEAVVRFFAKAFRVPQSAVRIVTGLTARLKIVEIDGVDPARVKPTLLP